MAVFYVGPRPVSKGRTDTENINPYTGERGVYSNWSIFNPSQVLDGAPNTHLNPGAGSFPHGLTLSRRFRGLDTKNPLDTPGLGAHVSGMRYRPLENKSAGNNKAFPSGFGHAPRATDYSIWDAYDDSERFVPLTSDSVGHAKRAHGATGTAATFGYFDHFIYKGVTTQPLADTDGGVPAGYDNPYGQNRINEWHGVTSAKALNV